MSAPATEKKPVKKAATEPEAETYRSVARVVFPVDGDTDTLPLYVDFNRAQTPSPDPDSRYGGQQAAQHPENVLGRRRFLVPAGDRVSFATYFNAFPAGYWRHWTNAATVRLTVRVSGKGTVIVYRSNARGNAQRQASVEVSNASHTFDLPLKNFGDGGWYWFDLAAATDDVTLEQADWSVPVSAATRPVGASKGRLTIGVTTYNRPDFCVNQMNKLADAPDVMERVERFVFVDQGTQHVADEPGYAEAAARLGDKLSVIRQANVGGSGGFARGMYEGAINSDSDYVLLLDDDVVVETEGIVRGVDFADFTREDMIVGGHMLNLYQRSMLHSFGEQIDLYRFFWGAAKGVQEAHDFATQNLRMAPWLHRRIDVDYNGWWMCLVPTKVVREIGLSLPIFIKWDDAEFGMRAKKAGYRTVSLPGSAVWHMPWTDKDDTIDWQAYYHQRNRWLVALLYSPYAHGGNLIKESFMVDVKHLLSMQYSAAELRLEALEDILGGPEGLHEQLPRRIGEVRATRKKYADAQVETDPAAFPPSHRARPPKRGRDVEVPKGRLSSILMAATGAVRQLTPVGRLAGRFPEQRVAAQDIRWWLLSQFDSAVVSTADGTGASWYRRSPAQFRSMLSRSVKLHEELYRRWGRLRQEYRHAHRDVVSVSTWEQTFREITDKDD